MFDKIFDLQMFAAEVTPITGTNVEVRSNAAHASTAMSDTMKTYYDTELLENARNEFYFEQFAKKQGLPANHGRTIEWRKWNTLPNAQALTEGVVPSGQKLGMTSINAALQQYGMYVAVTDLLDLHAIDNVILGASEELGASAGQTQDILIRNVLDQSTNDMLCDTVTNGVKTTPTDYSNMASTNNRLTPDMVNKAVTWMKKCHVPTINGKYIAIIHPSISYDLRSSNEWVEAHKYARPEEIFNGEIGELHGVRFIESHNAKIHQEQLSDGEYAVYNCYFLGKDAYACIDAAGGNMEMITKTREQIGGPLNQFSTIGYKFEDATKILYPERVLLVRCCSAYSQDDDMDN